MGLRRRSREIALHALYMVDLAPMPPKKAFSWVRHDSKKEDPAEEYAWELFEGTLGEMTSLDKAISNVSKNWKIERMAAADRNILRMAAYEILHHPETPVKVIINEAIEIARKYSTEESTAFINGILDKIKGTRKK